MINMSDWLTHNSSGIISRYWRSWNTGALNENYFYLGCLVTNGGFVSEMNVRMPSDMFKRIENMFVDYRRPEPLSDVANQSAEDVGGHIYD